MILNINTYNSYLLDNETKIIISDVDGTITKEDVMGHVMYAIHQDYTQRDIVKMYNRLNVLSFDFILYI